MNDTDLEVFGQAIQLANTNPLEAYRLLKIIEPSNPQNANLLSWLIFTAPDYAQKKYWVTRAHASVPNAPEIQNAVKWFESQPKPAPAPSANLVAARQLPSPFAQPAPPPMLPFGAANPGNFGRPPLSPTIPYTLSIRQKNFYRTLLACSLLLTASVLLPWVITRFGSNRVSLNALELYNTKGKFGPMGIEDFLSNDFISGYYLLIGSLVLAALAIIGLTRTMQSQIMSGRQFDKTISGISLAILCGIGYLFVTDIPEIMQAAGNPNLSRIIGALLGPAGLGLGIGFIFTVICLIACFVVVFLLIKEVF